MSTCPKTPEGRDAVPLNGLKHGLASDILVPPGENLSDFENLLDSLEAEHQPATHQGNSGSPNGHGQLADTASGPHGGGLTTACAGAHWTFIQGHINVCKAFFPKT
jgi:hypothetical protein